MNILVDIGHPGHVHLFRHVAEQLKQHGHNVYFTVRDIPVAKRLLTAYGMNYFDLGKKKDTLAGKVWTVLKQDWKVWRIVREKHIDFGLSFGFVLPHVSQITKMKAFTFDDDDDEVQPLAVKGSHPFSDMVFTPKAIKRKAKNCFYYNGSHELAYLHPNHFTPDERVLDKYGLKKGERFFLMRFVAFKGFHDTDARGLSVEQKRLLVEKLKAHGRVVINSERAVEPEFEQYRMPVAPEDIHSLMYYSAMFVGDGQTMTSEAAIMGVPALKCNTFAGKLSVPNMIERYELAYSYQPSEFEAMCKKMDQLLANENIKEEWAVRRERFLKDMTDPTALFVWFIENYPQSKETLKQNPNFTIPV